MCPAEGVVYARVQGCPGVVVLLADESLTADVLVARHGIELDQLRQHRIAYVRLDTPDFLLSQLIHEQHGFWGEYQTVAVKTPEEVVTLFNAGDVQAAAIYDVYVQKLRGEYRTLARSGERDSNRPPRIVDVLVVREDLLTTRAGRRRVETLIDGWYEGLRRLQTGDPVALDSASRFYGEVTGQPLTVSEWETLASSITFGDEAANRRFFEKPGYGRDSDLWNRLVSARSRLHDAGHLDDSHVDLVPADESALNLQVIDRRSAAEKIAKIGYAGGRSAFKATVGGSITTVIPAQVGIQFLLYPAGFPPARE